MSNDVAALVEGAFNIIPLFCLYEEDAEEIVDKEEEKPEEDKKDSEKEESKEEDESKKDDDSKDEEDVADDEDDKEDEEKSEEESEDENNTDLIEQYLTEAKRRKARHPRTVRAAYRLRNIAASSAREGNVGDAVAANEAASRLEAEDDESNRGK